MGYTGIKIARCERYTDFESSWYESYTDFESACYDWYTDGSKVHAANASRVLKVCGTNGTRTCAYAIAKAPFLGPCSYRTRVFLVEIRNKSPFSGV